MATKRGDEAMVIIIASKFKSKFNDNFAAKNYEHSTSTIHYSTNNLLVYMYGYDKGYYYCYYSGKGSMQKLESI